MKGQRGKPHAPPGASRPLDCPPGLDRCGEKVGGLKTLNNSNINRNRDGNPIPRPLYESEERVAVLFKAHQPGFENSAPPDARPSGIGLERAAELARGPALRPRRRIPGQGGGGAAPASRENAANGPPRARREKFISLFNLSLIHSFPLPRIFDKGGGEVLSLHFVARLSYLSTRFLGLLPLLPPPRVFVFEAPFLLCTTGKGNGQEEFYLLAVPETRWNPSRRSGAGRSVLSVSPLHLSPPPAVALPLSNAGALAGAPPRLLCS